MALGVSAGVASVTVLFLTALGSLAVFPCYYAFTQDLSRRHIELVTGMLAFCAWIDTFDGTAVLGEQIDRMGSYEHCVQVALARARGGGAVVGLLELLGAPAAE
ncbi:MAG: hypothetical protein R2748_24265 [Bryobacterales bacterium]